MSKQYAHLHTMTKTSVKFQNDWPKTVGGVALTSQLLTNGQTDERTDHGTPISHLRANAGATINDCLYPPKRGSSNGGEFYEKYYNPALLDQKIRHYDRLSGVTDAMKFAHPSETVKAYLQMNGSLF